MGKKGRPEKLNDNLKRYITNLQDNRKKKLTGPEIHKLLEKYLEAEIKKENGNYKISPQALEEAVKEKLPGLRSIQDYLNHLKSQLSATSELDNPWHLGTLEDYSLPSEAIPYILAVQRWVMDKNEKPLTIRHALWISRLYSLGGKLPLKDKYLQSLWAYAGDYAWYERICRLSGTSFDTTSLDEDMRKGKVPISEIPMKIHEVDLEEVKLLVEKLHKKYPDQAVWNQDSKDAAKLGVILINKKRRTAEFFNAGLSADDMLKVVQKIAKKSKEGEK